MRACRAITNLLKPECKFNTPRNFVSIPSFLCPRLLSVDKIPSQRSRSNRSHRDPLRSHQRRSTHTQALTRQRNDFQHETLGLPVSCPGCGALTQTEYPAEAGFFSVGRKSLQAVRDGRSRHRTAKKTREDEIYNAAVQNVEETLLGDLQVVAHEVDVAPDQLPLPRAVLCDRCHNLTHHHTGVPIFHPSITSIQETIAESPYSYNHIYHVLDAADFPLSLIPDLHNHLGLTPQRSLNRRSKTSKFSHGGKTEMSFIITRSDLLAPLKAQVDSLMPYFIGVLRDALDASGKDVRLGNVRCVSAKRGWWTKELKEDIWRRGGGGWMVGKVNVGKSNLFETVFPKGHLQQVDLGEIRRETGGEGVPLDQTEEAHINHISHPENPAICESHEQLKLLDETSLLPPAQSSTPFPQMPVVSSLPGTTASPIRIPFGPAGKGELIDLPGLARSNLDTHVQPAHRETLVMRSRAKPEQIVIKPSQSLLVGGGLIRITPKIPADTVLLAYPFLPLSTHVTATEKAVEIQTQKRESGIESILTEGVGEQISAAGTFRLDWDVTKQRSGPLTRPSAVGLQTGQLPYRVLATDILVEGCGWIELATQVRKKHLDPIHDDDVTSGRENPTAGSRLNGEACPEVEIFTPHGKYIGERRPMNAWLLGSKETRPKAEIKGRPRTSVKGQKKGQKLARSMTS